MKMIILISFLTVSSAAFADDYVNPYAPKFQTMDQYYQGIENAKRENMLRGLEREYYDTGRISPKTPADVYNLREGYGYDGGISVPGGNYPRNYGY